MNAQTQTLLAQAQKTLLTPYGLDVADHGERAYNY